MVRPYLIKKEKPLRWWIAGSTPVYITDKTIFMTAGKPKYGKVMREGKERIVYWDGKAWYILPEFK